MSTIQEQFLTDGDGNRVAVLLDLKTYTRLREAEEELADVRAYDKAKPKVDAEIRAGQFASLSEYISKRRRGKR